MDRGQPLVSAWPSAEEVPHNLPAPLTSLVGRQAEVAEVAGLFRESRLVTLVGPPGVGKTRLALHVAVEVLPTYPDGAWLVDLSLVSQPTLLVQAVASATSIRERAGKDLLPTVTSDLSDKRLLLVLDNCEHLLDACSAFVCRLAPICGNVTILATSRQALGVVGEIPWLVPTLTLPASDSSADVSASEAARLFLARVPGRVDLTDAIAAPVSHICRRLDGIPLALELAAGRVGELTPEEVEANLDHRFDLLRTDQAGISERQRSLRAALEWSHELLPEPERVLLRRLSVFAGPFTADSADEVGSLERIGGTSVTGVVARLATRSLLTRQTEDGHTLYRHHESIRHFAREKLREAGEEEAVCSVHTQWFARLVREADDLSEESEQAQSMAKLATSHADLRAALEWSMDHDRDPDLGLALAGGLTRFWVGQGHLGEAREWLARALAGGRGAPELRAKALWGAGLVACLLGDFAAVGPTVEEGLALARQASDGRMQARLLNLEGVTRIFIDPPNALEVLSEAVALARQHDETVTLVSSLAMLGFARALCGDLDAADDSLVECLDRGEHLGDSQPLAMGLVGLGHVRVHQGDLPAASHLLDDGLAIARRIGNPIWVALALAFLAELDTSLGDYVRGRHAAGEAATVARTTASAPVIGLCLAVTGNVELAAGEPAASVPWFNEALACCASGEQGGVRSRALVGLGRAALNLDGPEIARGLLEDALVVAQKGENRLATAAALYWLGRCADRRDDHEGALGMHREALVAQGRAGHHEAIPASVEAIAAELAHEGEVAKAARLLGAADSLRAGTGIARSPEDRANCDAVNLLAEETMDPADREAAALAGAQLPPERVVTYASGGSGPRKRPPLGWPSLTPTELRVVELVGEHLTNSEIGHRLLMAPGTVKTHLAHVYDKLNLRSRRAVAWEVLRRR